MVPSVTKERRSPIEWRFDDNPDLFKHVLSAAQLPAFVPYDLRHTFASLLLSSNVPLLYVSKQLGHAKPTTTLDHYAKWLPSGEQRFVDLLDSQMEKLGTRTWHQVDIIEGENAEVVGKFGGPCRGRTYGPLIKSGRRPMIRTARCCEGFPVYL